MQRRDGPALRDTAIWVSALFATGFGGYWFWGTWACVPFFLAYGVLYGTASNPRWHETGHGTAFKTRWMNDVLYQVACFMCMLRTPRLALEPCPAPHRHHRRRPRSGDRRTAPAELLDDASEPVQFAAGLEDLQRRGAPCGRPDECPGSGLYPRDPNGPRCSAPRGSGSASMRVVDRHRVVPAQLVAADAGRPAEYLRRLARLPVSASPSMWAWPKTCSTTAATAAPST